MGVVGVATGAGDGFTGASVERVSVGRDIGRTDPGRDAVPSVLVFTRAGFTLAFKWLMVSLTTENLMTFSRRRKLRVTSATVVNLSMRKDGKK